MRPGRRRASSGTSAGAGELGERIAEPALGDADRRGEPEELRLEREIEECRERLAELCRREQELGRDEREMER